ncbi:hypothetical protein Agabi119p4_6692 [Agaricus bisporus var. burnettii]|uniref:Methyltransferase domain-containing protein n=1 Tax=Agaricus bisporus var. burnettii TaxID=192524 RepID=A0A8H7CBX3_AGABI|nr:hypothetical protein Agabi119p4_6692 [Agaricus bisporus var. burnettii]
MSRSSSPVFTQRNEGYSGRFYISEVSEFSYYLPSDETERERLNLQSQLFYELFDNRYILPPISFKEGDIILDSGTGSGHWLSSVAKHVPETVQLRGIDISSRIFPPPSLTPPNVTFKTGSITSLPNEWNNYISFIHQRLLIGSLQEHHWKKGLSEMYRVLIPGGWVQLQEPNWTLTSPSQMIRDHTAYALKNELCRNRVTVWDIVKHLESWLEQAGFVNVELVEKIRLPLGSWGGERGRFGLKNLLELFRGFKKPIMDEDGLGLVNDEEAFDAMLDDLKAQCEATPGTYYEYSVFIGQKPYSP